MNLNLTPQVIDISRDYELHVAAVQTDAPRHLARLSQIDKLKSVGPHDYVYDPSAGNGVDVYVFDTGIRRDHPDLENRAFFGMDYTGEGSGDKNGHGKSYFVFWLNGTNV